MGRELSTIVRDLPIHRPRGGPPRRLRPRHRRAAVPRVRVPTLIERLPPMAGETAEQRPRPCGPSPRAATCRPHASPVGRKAGARAAPRIAASGGGSSSSGSTSMRSPPPADPHGPTGAHRPFEPTDDLPAALAAAIVDPGRSRWSARTGSPASSRGWRRSPTVGVSLLLDDPRPRRGMPLALAVVGTDGRVVAPRMAEASDALRRLLERPRIPLVGHEVKPVLVAALAEDPAAEPLPVAFDTQIAAYILNAATAQPDDRRHRRASTSTRSCHPRLSCPRRPGRASRRYRRWRSGSRCSDGSPTSRASSGCSARSSSR